MPSTVQLATMRRSWPRAGGASAQPHATYVTTASQSCSHGIRSQHSGKQEHDRPYGRNYYPAHINLPSVQSRMMRLAQRERALAHADFSGEPRPKPTPMRWRSSLILASMTW
jgi:hypothetical protein